MKKWNNIVIILLAALILTACGEATEDEPFVWPESIDGQSPFYGETLTIGGIWGTGWDGADMLRYVAAAYMRDNPGVTVELVSFSRDWPEGIERAGIELMAGTAPILIDSWFIDHFHPVTAQLLTDWYPIMAADPNFNEEDWFTNVFDTFTVDGRLYVFPTHFYYRFAQANSGIPDLVRALEAKDSITVAQIQELYREFGGEAPHLYLDMNFDAFMAVWNYLDSFLDFWNGMADFDNQEFIDLITYARDITSPRRRLGVTYGMTNYDRLHELEWAQRYLFLNFDGPFHFQYYLDMDDHRYFVRPTPIVNIRGELLVNVTEAFVLNGGATSTQKALAWDFVNFTANYPYERMAGGFSNMQPTNRNLLRTAVQQRLPDIRDNFVRQGWLRENEEQEDIERVIAKMTALAEMPMSTNTVPGMIYDSILEVIGQFHDGLILAEEAATDLQNRITLMIMEMN